MKNLILIIGVLLIAFNTLIGLIISEYQMFNFLLANLSLVLSTGILYFVAISKMADGFKIGLVVLFFFLGMIRCLCVVLSPQTWENNGMIIAASGILLFELACWASASFASKK